MRLIAACISGRPNSKHSFPPPHYHYHPTSSSINACNIICIGVPFIKNFNTIAPRTSINDNLTDSTTSSEIVGKSGRWVSFPSAIYSIKKNRCASSSVRCQRPVRCQDNSACRLHICCSPSLPFPLNDCTYVASLMLRLTSKDDSLRPIKPLYSVKHKKKEIAFMCACVLVCVFKRGRESEWEQEVVCISARTCKPCLSMSASQICDKTVYRSLIYLCSYFIVSWRAHDSLTLSHSLNTQYPLPQPSHTQSHTHTPNSPQNNFKSARGKTPGVENLDEKYKTMGMLESPILLSLPFSQSLK